ncbi:MAG: hypothetical protein AB7F35_27120, partial [Acetobacteraceae bacterium]
ALCGVQPPHRAFASLAWTRIRPKPDPRWRGAEQDCQADPAARGEPDWRDAKRPVLRRSSGMHAP